LNNIGSLTLNNSANNAISIVDDNSSTTILTTPDSVFGAGINKPTPGAAISITGNFTGGTGPKVDFFGTINNEGGLGSSPGYLINIAEVDQANISITGPGTNALLDTGDGVQIADIDETASAGSNISLANLDLLSTGANGINIDNVGNDSFTTAAGATSIRIQSAQIGGGVALAGGPSGNGVVISNVKGAQILMDSVNIDLQGATATGFAAGTVKDSTSGATSLIQVRGTSTIKTASDTAPSISIDDSETIELGFLSVESGTPSGSGLAIVIDASSTPPIWIGTPPTIDTPGTGLSTGFIDMSVFDVAIGTTPTQGNKTDVTNNSGTNASGAVTVRARGSVISQLPP
jgi:hypothetical protein